MSFISCQNEHENIILSVSWLKWGPQVLPQLWKNYFFHRCGVILFPMRSIADISVILSTESKKIIFYSRLMVKWKLLISTFFFRKYITLCVTVKSNDWNQGIFCHHEARRWPVPFMKHGFGQFFLDYWLKIWFDEFFPIRFFSNSERQGQILLSFDSANTVTCNFVKRKATSSVCAWKTFLKQHS